ncbi:MAG: hypothetical protein ACK5LC_01325, partial [Coprobacillaceae bacterium]
MRKIFIFILSIILLGISSVSALTSDNYDIHKENFLSESGDDVYQSVIPVEDGYIAVGITDSTIAGLTNKGDKDIIIVKYDDDDNVVWQNNFGGNSTDVVNHALTVDDGFILVGYTRSTDIPDITLNGSYASFILKFNFDGTLVWTKTFDGNGSDMLMSVTEVNDGYVATGYSNSTDLSGITNQGGMDAFIVKYDKQGNTLWINNFGGNGNDYYYSIATTNDGYVAVGYSNSTNLNGLTNLGGQDAIIVKYDTNGNQVWQKQLAGSSNDYYMSVVSNGSDIVVVGYTDSSDIDSVNLTGSTSSFIQKYDLNGNSIWLSTFVGNNVDRFRSISLIDDGYLVNGHSNSTNLVNTPNKGLDDALILLYDGNGNEIWHSTYGGNGLERFFSAIVKNDSIIAVGTTRSTDITNNTLNGIGDATVVKYANSIPLTANVTYNEEETYDPVTVTINTSKMVKDIPGWTRVNDTT